MSNFNFLLQKIEEKINNLQLRERLLICGGVFLLLFFIWQFFVNGPMSYRLETITIKADRLTAEIAQLTRQKADILAKTKKMSHSQIVRTHKQLQRQQQQLQKQLDSFTATARAPKQLDLILRGIINQIHGLQLESINSINLPEGNKLELRNTVKRANLINANHKSYTKMYDYTLVVKFSGEYFNTLTFLQRLEHLRWTLYWDQLDYRVTNYPQAQITLTLHTLTTSK